MPRWTMPTNLAFHFVYNDSTALSDIIPYDDGTYCSEDVESSTVIITPW